MSDEDEYDLSRNKTDLVLLGRFWSFSLEAKMVNVHWLLRDS